MDGWGFPNLVFCKPKATLLDCYRYTYFDALDRRKEKERKGNRELRIDESLDFSFSTGLFKAHS